MSAFYWALYIFIGIIVLLCLVSCVMYLTHLCSKEKDYDEEQFFQPAGSSHDTTTVPSPDITEATQLMSTSFTTGEQVQLTGVKRRTELYEQNIQEQTPTKPPIAPRPTSISKPPVPLKPNFDSRTSTPRNSAVIKPLNHPPPPPQIEVAVVHPHAGASVQKSSSIKKPKAPPPPPPTQPAENVYENVHKRTAPPPPTIANPPSYNDVISKIPVDNYLSDND